mgnify:CR=1 FL=1
MKIIQCTLNMNAQPKTAKAGKERPGQKAEPDKTRPGVACFHIL